MKLTVETATNGYLVTDDERSAPLVIGGHDPIDAAWELLAEINERIGVIGSRHAVRRVRVITLPGDKWYPRDRNECSHDSIEGWGSEPNRRWWCPCGAEFALVHQGRAVADLVAQTEGQIVAPHAPPAFGSLPSHPACTHREITAYAVAATGEPVPFWSCAACGRRFEPIRAG
jgi:hypothetical protein